ncbi:MAG: hypothetical protein ABI068_06365 [Ktedonobacterales bacterium]
MPEIEVDCFVEPVQDGDRLLLCTDGLSRMVADAEICAIVGQYTPEESVQCLIAFANERGGPDNITVVVVRVAGAEQGYAAGHQGDSDDRHAAD